MSDPKDEVDPRARRSQRLAADLFLDEDDGGGTVPERQALSPHNNEPPTVPIDLSGFQEMPLPEIAPAPLAFPPKESSANRMSASPPPTSGSYSFPGKEISGRHSGIRTIPAAQAPRPNDPAVSGSRPPDPALQQRIRELQPTQPMQTNLPPPLHAQPPALQAQPPAHSSRPAATKQPLPMWSPQPQPEPSSIAPAPQPSAKPMWSPQPQPEPSSIAPAPQPSAKPMWSPQPQPESQSVTLQLPLPAPAASPPVFASLLPPQAARPRVGLPASVLVVDDDTRAGALVASRLLEHGYSVRVARWSEAKAAAAEARYDVIIAEVGAEETRADAGRARIEPLRASGAPIVLTSAAVFRVELLRELPEVAAALTKPFFVEVLISTVESSRTRIAVFEAPRHEAPRHEAPRVEIPKPRDVTEPARPPAMLAAPAAQLAPLTETVGERRAAERYELDVNVVRALINGGPEQQSVRGRVRNISTAGGVLLDTASRLNVKSAVTAEFALYDGRVMLFNGRVVRQAKQELALKLDTDESQRAFLQKFIEDARAQDGRALQPVRINVKDEAAPTALDDVALMKRWLEVSDQVDDDEAQQRFIQDCLRAERIEFAVARYRDLKNAHPENERVGKYLLQLGTILSFKALSKKDLTTEKQKLPGSLKMVIGFFVLAGFALLLILIKVLR